MRHSDTRRLRRKMRGQVRLTNSDRMFFIQLYRWFPLNPSVLTIIRPETLVRWHQAFVGTGVGSHAHREGDPRLTRTCVR